MFKNEFNPEALFSNIKQSIGVNSKHLCYLKYNVINDEKGKLDHFYGTHCTIEEDVS